MISNYQKGICRFFIISSFILSGCGGVRIAQSSINNTLPPAYTTRSIYPSGVAAYDFNDLVGNVLEIKKASATGPLRLAIIRPADYKDSIQILTQQNSLNYYHSLITRGGAAQGAYLSFSASFTDDQTVEYTLYDIGQASIEFTPKSFNEVETAIEAWVKQHPRTDTSTKRIWLKSVVLSSSLYTAGVKMTGSASAVVAGPAVNVNGSIYSTSNETIKGTIIGFDYFDVDDMVSSMAVENAAPVKNYNKFKSKRQLTISGKIDKGAANYNN